MAALLALAVGVAAMGDAEAARKRSSQAASPKAAAIVVDANTGRTLYQSNADAPRYPASLTKMMTLYLTFEALKTGRISKTTQVPFSRNAAAEPPTKLGVRAGGSVSVETIIYSLVTKSANDSSTAIAEFLGGSEANFARMMTAKARQLGMTGTVFRNANGLPNPAQHSTARDLAVLGMALREHFPQYYGYFATRSFAYGKQRMANHNKLLGRVKGVDGIKTGYTRASGFNLVSSVSDGNRRIVAVVMGGSSGGARDRQMASLINQYMPKASARRGGAVLSEAEDSPIKAIAKAILLPKKNAPKPQVLRAEPEPEAEAMEPEVAAAPEPVVEQAFAEPLPERMMRSSAPKRDAVAQPAVDPIKTSSVAPKGWAIQVASSPSESEARAFLDKTGRAGAGVLADATGYTVTFEKGGLTYYRARFGGFGSKNAAWDACNSLKKKRIACYAVEQ